MSLKGYSLLKEWIKEQGKLISIRPTYLEREKVEKIFKYGEVDFFNTNQSALPLASTFFRSRQNSLDHVGNNHRPNRKSLYPSSEEISEYLQMTNSVYALLKQDLTSKCNVNKSVLYIGLTYFNIFSSEDREIVIDSSYWKLGS